MHNAKFQLLPEFRDDLTPDADRLQLLLEYRERARGGTEGAWGSAREQGKSTREQKGSTRGDETGVSARVKQQGLNQLGEIIYKYI